MSTFLVWVAVTMSSSTGTSYAPFTFASEADCVAFASQVAKSSGQPRCLQARVREKPQA